MENNNKSKNIIYIILLIILGLIILGLVGYICYDKGIIFSKNNKVEEKQEEKEVLIDDYALKQDLATKINSLNVEIFASGRGNILFNVIDSYRYRNDDLNNLSYDQKIFSVMNMLNAENLFSNYVKYEEMDNRIQESFKEEYELSGKPSYISDIMSISPEFVEEKYEMLFGEKITSHKDIDSTCPMYLYDTKANVYHKILRCGGTSVGEVYLYNNKYAKKGNEAYVYVNRGSCQPKNMTNDWYVYYDVDSDKVVENTTEHCKGFTINETNYTKYSEYKYTFTKDSIGNYYFTKVEKIK